MYICEHYFSVQATATPPPTAPKTTRPRPPNPSNQGSLRMVKGGQVGAVGGVGGGPETVLDSSPGGGGKGVVSQKIQQLLNTLKRPKKNRRPIEEYYQDKDDGEWAEFTMTSSLHHPLSVYSCFQRGPECAQTGRSQHAASGGCPPGEQARLAPEFGGVHTALLQHHTQEPRLQRGGPSREGLGDSHLQ